MTWLQWRCTILAIVIIAPTVITPAQSLSPAFPKEPISYVPPDKEAESQDPKTPTLLTPLKSQAQNAPYHPITAGQRLRWFITNTIGTPHLVGGIFPSALGTALD